MSAIDDLTGLLVRRGWRAPLCLALDIVAPFTAIVSQCAIAAGPLMPDARSSAWCRALGDAAGWSALAAALAAPDRPDPAA